MIYSLLTLAAVFGLTEQGSVLGGCGCGEAVETFNQAGSLYCPTSMVQSCNSSIIIEDSCTISCPGGPRTSLLFRNGTTTFTSTTSVKCEGGNLTTGEGKKVASTWLRPTCGSKATCSACPMAYETKCPTGFTCNPDNLRQYIEDDGCARVRCNNAATLNIYDANKNLIPDSQFYSKQLYCAINNKWFNSSYDGQAVGTSLNNTITANCILPKACETCNAPNFVTNITTQVPPKFRTGYKTLPPTVTRQAGQCATSTCPNGFLLMGFTSGTNDTQTGVEALSEQYMKCDQSGLWRNGDLSYTPQTLYTICMQKITVCPPTDNILSGSYNVTCDAQTKVSSCTCAAGQKLVIRYSTSSDITKYDRATFFEGKGWLAHGCDATAALFTTVAGKQITAYCS